MKNTELKTCRGILVIITTVFMAMSSLGCGDNGEEINRGIQALGDYGCSSCHSIPGVQQANGVVGPPLDFWAARSYIAGAVVNNHNNLVLWLMDPQAIEPGTVMSNMDVTETDAHKIGDYLYTLQGNERGHVSVRGHTGIPLIPSSTP